MPMVNLVVAMVVMVVTVVAMMTIDVGVGVIANGVVAV